MTGSGSSTTARPGGESWADVALRVRAVLTDLANTAKHRRVLVTGHDVVLLLFCYVAEGLDEEQVLARASDNPLRNASICRLRTDADSPTGWDVTDYNIDAHLQEDDVTVTDEPGAAAEVASDDVEPHDVADPDGGAPGAPRLVTPDLLRAWPLPEPTGSKYARGQVLVVGGSCTTPGAVVLAGTAALRMGAGRLTVATAEGVAAQLAVALPVCGTLPLPQDDEGFITGLRVVPLLEDEVARADAVLVGPGLLGDDGTVRLLTAIAGTLPADLPIVLDAAAVTALPDLDRSSAQALGGRLVLTPTPTSWPAFSTWTRWPRTTSSRPRYGSPRGWMPSSVAVPGWRPTGACGRSRPATPVWGRPAAGTCSRGPWSGWSAAGPRHCRHCLGQARPCGGRRRPGGSVGSHRLPRQ